MNVNPGLMDNSAKFKSVQKSQKTLSKVKIFLGYQNCVGLGVYVTCSRYERFSCQVQTASAEEVAKPAKVSVEIFVRAAAASVENLNI